MTHYLVFKPLEKDIPLDLCLARTFGKNIGYTSCRLAGRIHVNDLIPRQVLAGFRNFYQAFIN